MSATVSVVHILPFAAALPVVALIIAAGWVLAQMRGLATEMRALDEDLAQARATPMTVRVTVRRTGAHVAPMAGRDQASVRHQPALARERAPVMVPDRSPLLDLAPAGRAAA